MTEEAKVKSVALFYYLTLLDEAIAQHATEITLTRCDRRIEKEKALATAWPAIIVNETNKAWQKFSLSKGKEVHRMPDVPGWQVPKTIDFGLWQEFSRKAEKNELLALVWSQILGFSDEDIAQGLNSSRGTIRHRVGRALRELGRTKK